MPSLGMAGYAKPNQANHQNWTLTPFGTKACRIEMQPLGGEIKRIKTASL